jgi:AraC family transcriptional regulator
VQGETVADTIRRLRLHRAAVDRLAGELPIARIATRAGYGSQAAFTRAFRSAYGAPPAAYRAVAPSRPGAYPVERRHEPEVTVAALRHEGDFGKIGGTFDRLLAIAGPRGGIVPSTRFFGIYYCDPLAVPVEQLRSDACLTVPPDFRFDAPLTRVTIAGGPAAVLLHVGPYAELPLAYDWLYGEWLLASGLDPADAPCVEEYLNDPRDTPPSELRTEIRLPLAAESTCDGDGASNGESNG